MSPQNLRGRQGRPYHVLGAIREDEHVKGLVGEGRERFVDLGEGVEQTVRGDDLLHAFAGQLV